MNPEIAQDIRVLKQRYQTTIIGSGSDRLPLLHGLGLEQSDKRYYPYGTFMSHILGYVNEDGDPFYGVEKFFEEQLRGKDGKIE
jgi:cell division protein FtsI/penicillin-binding protein 2